MINTKQAAAKRQGMAQRAEERRKLHFPLVTDHWLWSRKRASGYTTIPRTLPIVMEGIDAVTKGQPAGHTLFTLWCRAPDDPLVTIENPSVLAAEAGFTGERAIDTWRRRMRALRDLQFIMAAEGASGEFHYVLLLNPNIVMELMHLRDVIPHVIYARFLDRAMEVGAARELDGVRTWWESEKTAAVPPPDDAAEK